jgi:hypothetical protein
MQQDGEILYTLQRADLLKCAARASLRRSVVNCDSCRRCDLDAVKFVYCYVEATRPLRSRSLHVTSAAVLSSRWQNESRHNVYVDIT